MSLKIRLSRGGAKKHPFYRIVVADSRSPRDGRFIERVGTYDPMVPKDHSQRLVLKEERIKYWLGVGGKPTDRVARMLAQSGLMEAPAIPEQTKQHLPRTKTVERQQQAEDAAAAPKEEAAAEAEAPKEEPAEAEAPKEEVAAEAEAPKEEAAEAEAPKEEAAEAEAPKEETAVEEVSAKDSAKDDKAAS